VNAIAAHHGDEEFTSPISVLVQAAVPYPAPVRARRESLEVYINDYRNWKKSPTVSRRSTQLCLQAGRESARHG